jgi:hypothetical protein
MEEDGEEMTMGPSVGCCKKTTLFAGNEGVLVPLQGYMSVLYVMDMRLP